MEENVLLNAKQVAKIMNVGLVRAYEVMKDLNKELKAKGFYTVPHRISKVYLMERIRGTDNVSH